MRMFFTSGATQLWDRYWPDSADLRDELEQLIATVDNPMLLVNGFKPMGGIWKRKYRRRPAARVLAVTMKVDDEWVVVVVDVLSRDSDGVHGGYGKVLADPKGMAERYRDACRNEVAEWFSSTSRQSSEFKTVSLSIDDGDLVWLNAAPPAPSKTLLLLHEDWRHPDLADSAFDDQLSRLIEEAMSAEFEDLTIAEYSVGDATTGELFAQVVQIDESNARQTLNAEHALIVIDTRTAAGSYRDGRTESVRKTLRSIGAGDLALGLALDQMQARRVSTATDGVHFNPADVDQFTPDTLVTLTENQRSMIRRCEQGQERPLFMASGAGSSKSTILHHIFAIYAHAHLDAEVSTNSDQLTPLFVTKSPSLLKDARGRVDTLLRTIYPVRQRDDIAEFLRTSMQTHQEHLLVRVGRSSKFADPAAHVDFERFVRWFDSSFTDHRTRDSWQRHTEFVWFAIRSIIKGFDPSVAQEIRDLEDRSAASRRTPLGKQILEIILDLDPEDEVGSAASSVHEPSSGDPKEPLQRLLTQEPGLRSDLEEIGSAIYPRYSEFLRVSNLWDDQDLAFDAISTGRRLDITPVSALVGDEVQDFTRLELLAMLRGLRFLERDPRSNHQAPVYLAGDEYQNLELTTFSWSDTTSWFYELAESARRSSVNVQFKRGDLSENFRSRPEIVNVANAVQEIRRRRLDEEGARRQSSIRASRGRPVRFIDPESVDPDLLRSSLRSVVITPAPGNGEASFIRNDEVLSRCFEGYLSEVDGGVASNTTGQPVVPVYTASSVKGLDYPQVILYGWAAQLSALDLDRKDTATRQRNRNRFAALYVALTRPTEELVIIDSDRNFWFDLLSDCDSTNFSEGSDEDLQHLIDGLAAVFERQLVQGIQHRNIAELVRAFEGFTSLDSPDASVQRNLDRARAMILLIEASADPSSRDGERRLDQAAQLFDVHGERETASNLLWAARNWRSLESRLGVDPAWSEVATIMLESEPTPAQILRLGSLITSNGAAASQGGSWTTGADLRMGTWRRVVDHLHDLTIAKLTTAPSQWPRLLESLDAATEALDWPGPSDSLLRRPRTVEEFRNLWDSRIQTDGEPNRLILGWQLRRAIARFEPSEMRGFLDALPDTDETHAIKRACLEIADDRTVSVLLLWEMQRLDSVVLDLSINLGEPVS